MEGFLFADGDVFAAALEHAVANDGGLTSELLPTDELTRVSGRSEVSIAEILNGEGDGFDETSPDYCYIDDVQGYVCVYSPGGEDDPFDFPLGDDPLPGDDPDFGFGGGDGPSPSNGPLIPEELLDEIGVVANGYIISVKGLSPNISCVSNGCMVEGPGQIRIENFTGGVVEQDVPVGYRGYAFVSSDGTLSFNIEMVDNTI